MQQQMKMKKSDVTVSYLNTENVSIELLIVKPDKWICFESLHVPSLKNIVTLLISQERKSTKESLLQYELLSYLNV